MKRTMMLLTFIVVGIFGLTGCQVEAPVSAAEPIDVTESSTWVEHEESPLIMDAGHLSGIGQVALDPGKPVVGRYEMQPLPSGDDVALKLYGEGCESYSTLILSAGQVPGIGQASLTQGKPTVGLYELQPLPNGEIAIRLDSNNNDTAC